MPRDKELITVRIACTYGKWMGPLIDLVVPESFKSLQAALVDHPLKKNTWLTNDQSYTIVTVWVLTSSIKQPVEALRNGHTPRTSTLG